MIHIEALSKSYNEVKALDNLSLTIPSNSIFGLLGPNGAGKTTLMSILNGLLTYDAGKITFFDLPLSQNLKVIRERCSLIPQSLAFYDQLTVKENLNFFAGIQGIKGSHFSRNFEYAIETNRLSSMLERKASTLSGGQKRRLNIAIGLLNNPDVLFFDEPTVGIDPESRNDILDSIKEYARDNKTIVYTSHYMPEIEKICDEVAIINSGKIIKQGTIDEMVNNHESQQVVVELYPQTQPVDALFDRQDIVQVIDNETLLLNTIEASVISTVLSKLEESKIKVKHIRYGTTTLESMFIQLTSKGRCDV
ncbi:ABC transporter ATP-binding protein [Vibrio ziniensis]|uniref:ABC transporter ATP-binding protein n=1 Tax=Vibrio ziniensis TaxID=2711221 RepID=A0A6G7CJE6_9VIBR|nr:ABC transporter ATP-binding protein [Vibrio ziniensis]QIH42222.1 ABC transporter ATP-binding protein [Vibrio ziniensis]